MECSRQKVCVFVAVLTLCAGFGGVPAKAADNTPSRLSAIGSKKVYTKEVEIDVRGQADVENAEAWKDETRQPSLRSSSPCSRPG